MPYLTDNSRVSAAGRAYAGSQRQIQTYVNERRQALNLAVAHSLAKYQISEQDIHWMSPLASDSYLEYRDSEFLERVGLAHHTQRLAEFWPKRGPCWDALARIPGGCILVEAKSHVNEIRSGGCTASSRMSRGKILAALAATKVWLGVQPDYDWTGPLYQAANRYAHLYFLAEIARVPAFLINIYFVGDPHPNPLRPTTRTEWDAALEQVKADLGIVREVPYSSNLFLQV